MAVRGVPTIDAASLQQKLDIDESVLLIDVLSEDSYLEQHLPGAVNVPVDEPEFINRIETIAESKSRDIIVYSDQHDRASPLAAEQLRQAGFTRGVVLQGGMTEWRNAGLPLESEFEAA